MRRKVDGSNTTSVPEKAFKMLAVSLALIAFLMLMSYGVFLWFIEPPESGVGQAQSTSLQTMHLTVNEELLLAANAGPEIVTIERLDLASGIWRNGVYSVLILGEDDGFGGPDVIMVALLDTNERSLDVLSIPRDTMVNVPWGLKKINSIQAYFRQLPGNHTHYAEAMAQQVGHLIGHVPQNWITLDLGGFTNLVNAVGGVEFYVPQNMEYSDPEQDLNINLRRGSQRLNGDQAMQLVRFRSFPQGDIARIGVQQDFMHALAQQLLSIDGLLAIGDLIRIFEDNVDTNMSLRSLAFLAYELLRLDGKDIRFHSVSAASANITDHVNGISYVSLYVEPWLLLINRYMNPFTWEIIAEDLEILTRNLSNGQLMTTNDAEIIDNWAR